MRLQTLNLSYFSIISHISDVNQTFIYAGPNKVLTLLFKVIQTPKVRSHMLSRQNERQSR